MNPTSAARGIFGKSIQMYYKYLNNPDRYIRKIFNALRETTTNHKDLIKSWSSGKVSPTNPIPLPKGKGEIP